MAVTNDLRGKLSIVVLITPSIPTVTYSGAAPLQIGFYSKLGYALPVRCLSTQLNRIAQRLWQNSTRCVKSFARA